MYDVSHFDANFTCQFSDAHSVATEIFWQLIFAHFLVEGLKVVSVQPHLSAR